MGAGKVGNFGNTKGSRLDAISDLLSAASLIPGLDTFTNLASIPVDLARGDFVSAGLSAIGVLPVVGELADTARLAKTVDKVADAAKVADKAADIGKLSRKSSTIAKRSPIRIPKKATTQVQAKKGYSQIKYTWESGNYKYTSRWHTRTPNAPKNQGTSWVVERKSSGIGYGKNARPKKEEVLVGKNKWISKRDWKNAITARKNGTLTKKQKEWLDNGHWKD
ncbi:MAG: hypothetical protein IKC04_01895 [Oscillospiraceae bacterium]|nr:hypothetical protein [Oscillospiraceae bacterium]